jgi:hypothetical protein
LVFGLTEETQCNREDAAELAADLLSVVRVIRDGTLCCSMMFFMTMFDFIIDREGLRIVTNYL